MSSLLRKLKSGSEERDYQSHSFGTTENSLDSLEERELRSSFLNRSDVPGTSCTMLPTEVGQYNWVAVGEDKERSTGVISRTCDAASSINALQVTEIE
jgi:hypothetical protein